MATGKSIGVSGARSMLDMLDELEGRLAQLDSMLAIAYGEGGEAFRSYSDKVQDNYLLACSTLNRETMALAERINQQAHAEGRP